MISLLTLVPVEGHLRNKVLRKGIKPNAGLLASCQGRLVPRPVVGAEAFRQIINLIINSQVRTISKESKAETWKS
jgi:hypothetical protein